MCRVFVVFLSVVAGLSVVLCGTAATAADRSLDENPELAAWFEDQVSDIERHQSLLKYATLQEWQAEVPVLRQQLFRMLGLDPLPERTDLQVQVTGVQEGPGFTVRKLSFQSSPGLYVTGNLFVPAKVAKPCPAVLYVCGHGGVKQDGISFGNKFTYHHHGAWFARNGYVCLVIDTLQLGEIEGVHHGTYRENRWWWNSRGYTPAGVEAWNCIRALDFLETCPEVDSQRMGVSGRSGGGAYSWWIAALDERIQCAVPVAGITSLRKHVVDGCVEGHCDCMFMVNTFGWDYAKVAALVAPRPLLISNTDKDTIFPLDGVVNVHRQVSHIYDLYQKPERLGLQITEGPHKDTQELRIHAFRWMNRWLKQDESLIEMAAVKFFEPPQLKVFADLPADEVNTRIDQTFVPQPKAATVDEILKDPGRWVDRTTQHLQMTCFRAWPNSAGAPAPLTAPTAEFLPKAQTSKHRTIRISFSSQPHVNLTMDVFCPAGGEKKQTPQDILNQQAEVTLIYADQTSWQQNIAAMTSGNETADETSNPLTDFIREEISNQRSVAVVTGRGRGTDAWQGDPKKLIQIERRFQLIGTTSDAMRVWDLRQAVGVLHQVSDRAKIDLKAVAGQEVPVLLASLYCGPIQSISVLPGAPTEPPAILNLDRTLNVRSELIALAGYRTPVRLAENDTLSPDLLTAASAGSSVEGSVTVASQWLSASTAGG
ncbi:MAG: acetylxylan esterase [Planctomycetaceae bacterium]